MAKSMMDIKLDSEGDVVVASGDFVIVESKAEHNKNLILSSKGEFTEFPTVCVGAINYVDDENPHDLIRAITAELQRDGMDVKSVAMEGEIIVTDGYYK